MLIDWWDIFRHRRGERGKGAGEFLNPSILLVTKNNKHWFSSIAQNSLSSITENSANAEFTTTRAMPKNTHKKLIRAIRASVPWVYDKYNETIVSLLHPSSKIAWIKKKTLNWKANNFLPFPARDKHSLCTQVCVYIHTPHSYYVLWCPFNSHPCSKHYSRRESATKLRGKDPLQHWRTTCQVYLKSWIQYFLPLLWSAMLNPGKWTVFTHGNQKHTETKYPRYSWSSERGKIKAVCLLC